MNAFHRLPAGGSWGPWTPCTEQDCLPPHDPPARLRVALRSTAMIVQVVAAVLGALLLPGPARGRWLGLLSRGLLAAAGIRLVVRGDDVRFTGADRHGVLVVANHLSWMEVLALNAVQPVRLLAKREIRDWPLIGLLATRTGSLFVDRSGLHALPATVAETATALRAGAVVGVFPEATTFCGAGAGPFRRAAFQAAIDAGAPVRPVAFRLLTPRGEREPAASFIGEQTLWDALGRVLRLPGMVCEITVLPVVWPEPGETRRELAERAGAAVGAVTGVTHPVRRRPAPAPAVAAA